MAIRYEIASNLRDIVNDPYRRERRGAEGWGGRQANATGSVFVTLELGVPCGSIESQRLVKLEGPGCDNGSVAESARKRAETKGVCARRFTSHIRNRFNYCRRSEYSQRHAELGGRDAKNSPGHLSSTDSDRTVAVRSSLNDDISKAFATSFIYLFVY